MGFFVVDRILMLLVKGTIRVLRFFQTSNWERVRASVIGCRARLPTCGCPIVRVRYNVISNGHSVECRDEIPFETLLSAERYVQKFFPNMLVIVRVNPKDPQETRFFELDQKGRSRVGLAQPPGQ